MVTIRTMISDLYHNHSRGVQGVGYLAATRIIQEQAVLSPTHRVKEFATPITLAVGGGPDNIISVDHADMNTAMGFALFFEDARSTIATLTRAHRIVVGGGYSGCLYSVYHAGRGVYICVHTARPADGRDPDRYVFALREYADDQRWTLVHEVPTRNDGVSGPGINGCVTTFLATRVSYTVQPKPVVRTVRLRQDNQGLSVGWDRWETPTP
jgi:hypothetical protein